MLTSTARPTRQEARRADLAARPTFHLEYTADLIGRALLIPDMQEESPTIYRHLRAYQLDLDVTLIRRYIAVGRKDEPCRPDSHIGPLLRGDEYDAHPDPVWRDTGVCGACGNNIHKSHLREEPLEDVVEDEGDSDHV